MTENEIKQHLRMVKYPGFSRDIVSFGVVKEVSRVPDGWEIRLSMITDNEEVVGQIVADVERTMADIPDAGGVRVVVERPSRDRATEARQMATAMGRGPKGVVGIGAIVAVASGKGGVGKSTVAANLAVALARRGVRVGLLDCDIYGPSVPTMFAIRPGDQRGNDESGRMQPLVRHGVRLLSMGMFVGEGTPLIWRGPMLGKALGQFLGDVAWGDLDILLLDLPPGTGDVQMTLTQSVQLDGGIIVTTPQDVALADVERGLKMFQQAGAPVFGIVENMSYHVCSCCGRRTAIFGDGGALRVAARFGIDVLGALPLLREVREAGDAGQPAVVGDPDGDIGRTFQELADTLMNRLAAREVQHA